MGKSINAHDENWPAHFFGNFRNYGFGYNFRNTWATVMVEVSFFPEKYSHFFYHNFKMICSIWKFYGHTYRGADTHGVRHQKRHSNSSKQGELYEHKMYTYLQNTVWFWSLFGGRDFTTKWDLLYFKHKPKNIPNFKYFCKEKNKKGREI